MFQEILALINSALDPLLDAIKQDLESHIFKMHSEDFARYICGAFWTFSRWRTASNFMLFLWSPTKKLESLASVFGKKK